MYSPNVRSIAQYNLDWWKDCVDALSSSEEVLADDTLYTYYLGRANAHRGNLFRICGQYPDKLTNGQNIQDFIDRNL